MHIEYLMEKELVIDDISSPYMYSSSPLTSDESNADIPAGALRYDFCAEGIHVGKFCILPYSDGTVYFFGFEIDKPGHGTGTYAFPHILNFLALSGYKKIRLQVSSENTAAMKLYRDFEIIEQVSL